MFNFTSLLGAQSHSTASQSILELKGGVKILVGVGWDETFDETLLKELERHVPSISLILLTHATIAHIGAFAHCCKHVPLFSSIPVYATAPVIALGRTLSLDIYKSTPLAASVIPPASLADSAYAFPSLWDRGNLNLLRQAPRPEEIVGYFSLIHPLKYSQPHQPLASSFSTPLDGLTITAYSAGHTLGGTVWHIQHGLESLVYAVDWNQATEHIISGAAWLKPDGAEVIDGLRRPTALVCSSKTSQRVALEGGRSRRDELLLEHVKTTIEQGGTVLIPSDSSARVLEVAFLLEQAWAAEQRPADDGDASMQKVGLYLVSTSADSTLRQARGLIDWMEEDLVRDYEAVSNRTTHQQKDEKTSQLRTSARTPFDFNFVKTLTKKNHLQRVLGQDGPKVILGSDLSLEWGLSRVALQSIAQDPRNVVIFTERNNLNADQGDGVGSLLWQMWLRQAGVATADSITEQQMRQKQQLHGHEVHLRHASTQPITGEELAVYQQFLAKQRQMQVTVSAEKGTALESAADAVDDRSSTTSESSEESDAEHQGKSLNVSAAMAHSRNKIGLTDTELGIDVLIRRKGYHDYDVQGKKGRERSFPVFIAKRNQRTDDFGDAIRPEDYLRAEERDDVDGDEARDADGRQQSAIGQKRKWGDVAAKSTPADHQMSNGTGTHSRPSVVNAGTIARTDPAVDSTLLGDADMLEDADDFQDDDEATIEGPQKAVFTIETLRLNLQLAYVDFCGLHDRRSLQMLIPLIRPRKLILIGGEEAETQALAAECKRLLNTDSQEAAETEVFTPVIGITIDASVDTNAWLLRASKPFARQLQWQSVKGLGVVALTGSMAAIELGDADPVKKKLKITGGPSEETPERTSDTEAGEIPVIDDVPNNLALATRLVTQSFHVGDLRLAELRKLMQAAGFAADFRGEGTLLVNGMVAIRKSGTGRLEVEGIMDVPTLGGPDPTFYNVRRKVYEGLAIVAGG